MQSLRYQRRHKNPTSLIEQPSFRQKVGRCATPLTSFNFSVAPVMSHAILNLRTSLVYHRSRRHRQFTPIIFGKIRPHSTSQIDDVAHLWATGLRECKRPTTISIYTNSANSAKNLQSYIILMRHMFYDILQ